MALETDKNGPASREDTFPDRATHVDERDAFDERVSVRNSDPVV